MAGCYFRQTCRQSANLIKYNKEIETKDKKKYTVKEQIPSSGITINVESSVSVTIE